MQDTQVNSDLINQGVELMIFGMGTVFVFLAVLVVVTTSMSFIINRFFPDQVPSVEPNAQGVNQAPADDANLLAVITAAVHQYRSRQK